jgi:Flp pilus assembly protein TadG
MAMSKLNFQKDEGGQVLVELGLAFTVLIMIMAGALELSRAFYADYEVNSAARAGLQWAAVNDAPSSTSSIQTAATNDAPNLIGMTATATEVCQCDSGSTVTCGSGTCASGSVRYYAKVVTSFPYKTLGTYPYIPRPMTLTGVAYMRIQ